MVSKRAATGDPKGGTNGGDGVQRTGVQGAAGIAPRGGKPQGSGNITAGDAYTEFGANGLKQYSGYVREEWLPQLIGRKGLLVLREMRDNDPIIGAAFYAIEMMIRGVNFNVEGASDSAEDQGAADFIESCVGDMEQSWSAFLAEVMPFLLYGWDVHEIVYKQRKGRTNDLKTNSKYDDGLIGWRKFAIRSQETLLHWIFDEAGDATHLVQLLPTGGPLLQVPLEKCLHFRTTPYKCNPEGRPLPLDTPVKTPGGWTTMGEIPVGAQVYDENGVIRSVTGKSEVFTDRPVYEIEFTTGATIRADACHIWRVSNLNDRTNGRTRDMTTEQIAAEFDRLSVPESDARKIGKATRSDHRKARSISCGMAPVLCGTEASLPLDPYLLGYWLGDGVTKKAAISVCQKDYFSLRAEIERCGFTVNHDGNTTIGISNGFLFGLRAAGVFGDKHVPEAYMQASPEQRLAVLQGLMDSDGYSPGPDAHDEASTFSNTNMRLIEAVEELVRSLGGQPRRRILEVAGAMGGVINGHQIVAKQTSYEVRFMLDQPVHRLARKRHAQVMRRTHRNSAHFIKSVQRVENDDTVCIEVDSPSHLFLAGRSMVPTHNSIVRNCYTSYYYKKTLQEIEAIGVARDLTGLTVVHVPAKWTRADADVKDKQAYRQAVNMAQNIARNQQEGLVIPLMYDDNGNKTFEVSLLSTGGRRQFATNEIIGRYDQNMASTLLADFITLGTGHKSSQGTGSQAESKVDMFVDSLVAFLDIITAEISRKAIPDLLALNGMTGQAVLVHGDVKKSDLKGLGTFLLDAAQAGVLTPDDTLESYVREEGGFPALNQAGMRDLNDGTDGGDEGEDDDDAADDEPGDPARAQGAGGGATPQAASKSSTAARGWGKNRPNPRLAKAKTVKKRKPLK